MLVIKKQMLGFSMGMRPKLSSLTKDLVWPLRGKNQPVWIHVNAKKYKFKFFNFVFRSNERRRQYENVQSESEAMSPL